MRIKLILFHVASFVAIKFNSGTKQISVAKSIIEIKFHYRFKIKSILYSFL